MPLSPPQSVASGSSPSSPLTIKKLVADGRSKVCIDNIQPGTILPLFPENNARILSSDVHPLDDRFIPYHFSLDDHPSLQKAINSLRLAPMSPKTYSSLFNTSDPDTSRRHRGFDPVRCSAQLLVSAYTVSLALPKEFPPSRQSPMNNDEEESSLRNSQYSRSVRRQSSAFNRSYLNFVVAIELSIPFLTVPPRGPFLISIPVPRCLDNQLRMRIAIPPDPTSHTTRHPGDSTSSGEDMAGWDFLTDPPVTRRLDKPKVRNEDEDHPSDQTPITPGVEVIQGAFQSTDYLHIRWAPPLPKRSRPENGLWRVNMQSSAAIMKCQILGRNEACIRMGISYDAKCHGLWHPGVATIVGLDVVLDAKRRTIIWPEEDHLKGWSVSAKGEAFVGIHKDAFRAVSQHSSFESAISSTFLPTLNSDSMLVPPRGSASLLHAPLPSSNSPDYSFENSSPNGTVKEDIHLPAHTAPPSGASLDILRTSKDIPPNMPITLKINMLKLLSSPKNEISFTIRGVILIQLDQDVPEDFIPLPKLHVLGIHTQEVRTWVSMHMPINKDIYIDEEHPSEHGRQRLTKGEEVRCEEETVLIVTQRAPMADSSNRRSPLTIGSANDTPSPSRKSMRTLRNSPLSMRTPVSTTQPEGQTLDASLVTVPSLGRLKTLDLAHVVVTITPLKNSFTRRCSYCVKVTLPVYSLESDIVRFGLATRKILGSEIICPNVDMLYATYSGRQIPTEIYQVADGELELTASNVVNTKRSESQIFGEMQYSVSLNTGGIETDSGPMDCVYLVDYPAAEMQENKKGVTSNEIELDALLPCFHIPVCRYEVLLELETGMFIAITFCPKLIENFITKDKYSLKSTTLNQQSYPKFSQYHVPAGFYPSLHILLLPSSPRKLGYIKFLNYILAYVILILTISQLVWFKRELLEMRSSVHAILYGLMNGGDARSFVEGHYMGNEDYMGSSRDWRHLETPVIIVSTVTTTFTVTETLSIPTASIESKIEDDEVRIIRLSDATLVQPLRPTLVPPPPPPRATTNKEAKSLIPLPAIPLLSFKLPFSDETRGMIVKNVMRFVYFLRRAWNFPMDPD
ncbi:hypothetical protein Clacol_006612 [Clathrus columnatus]|uniref:Uncharacterized protein n=1 Tax=Clathrus columnatus TaxID=1419009 RepID=A0AAV5AHC9_9AGAM|nr:hypothetical protein Clacol_006612 [Clathrus columnatus]